MVAYIVRGHSQSRLCCVMSFSRYLHKGELILRRSGLDAIIQRPHTSATRSNM